MGRNPTINQSHRKGCGHRIESEKHETSLFRLTSKCKIRHQDSGRTRPVLNQECFFFYYDELKTQIQYSINVQHADKRTGQCGKQILFQVKFCNKGRTKLKGNPPTGVRTKPEATRLGATELTLRISGQLEEPGETFCTSGSFHKVARPHEN